MSHLITPVTITERISDWHSTLSIDSSRRLISNVALAGLESRNGYHYVSDALREAVPLYENKPVFLDHPSDRRQARDRSTRDLAGSIINPRFEQGRVRGDIQVLDTPSGQTLLALADARTPGIGMSHVVLAEKSADGKQVNRIHDVISVDVVINPATTVTFQESACHLPSQLPPAGNAPPSTQFNQLISDIHTLREERSRLEEQIRQVIEELGQLKVRVHVQQLIESARIPVEAVTAELRRHLEQLPDDQSRRRVLHSRGCLLREQAPVALSAPRSGTAQAPAAEDLFISAIRRR